MKNKFKDLKGQTSLEYLMTYGWMLIIIGIVGVVLYQYGVFTPPTTPPGCTGFSQAKPIDWKMSTAGADKGNLTMTLINDAGTKIRITQVNATVFTNPLCTTGVIAQELRAGEVYQLSMKTCVDTGSPGSGEYYKADIIIVYQNVASGIDHNSVGECHGTLES
jgi:uncharacterized protein (UPF0333 family)